MRMLSAVAAVSLAAGMVLAGPPRITVRPVAPATPGPIATFDLDVDHHVEPNELTVTARAEGTAQGKRVSQPLTLTRVSSERFTLARQWAANTPWVLVITAEQGEKGKHGVVEALVSINAAGAVANIEYTKAGFHQPGKEPHRVSPATIERALSKLAAR